MKSYHVRYGGGLDGLTVREGPQPEPGLSDVLIRVCANSLNARELAILRGQYPLPVSEDVIALSDGAGEVIAVGPKVRDISPGDRVMGIVFPRWFGGKFELERAGQLGGSLDGLLTEYTVLDQDAVLHVPSHLSFEEAATLPCAAVTAWNALTGGRGLCAGETVLTLGSSGVSLFAIQFAKLFGTRVIATAGSAEKAARLRDLGADHVINYNVTPKWPDAVREITSGQGVEHVIDVVGDLNKSLHAVVVGGEIAFVGSLGGVEPIDPALLFGAVATVRSIALGSRAHFVAMNRAISVSELRPVIDRVFSFDDAAAAYRYYQEARPFGKVVITHLPRT